MNPDPEIFVDVDDGVYSPSDDTFLLLASIEINKGEGVLEVGTGSGIIALHCAKAGAAVVATDISKKALSNSMNNARVNSLAVDFVQADLARGIKGEFDVIIFNLPYLGSEDSLGLLPEERQQVISQCDDLSVPAKFLELALNKLKENGRIYIIVSSEEVVRTTAKALSAYELGSVALKRLFFETLYVYELRKKMLAE